MVTAGPERALNIPKAVSGSTNVLMSLRVKSQTVVRKYERLEIQVQVLLRGSFYVFPMSLERFDTVRRFFSEMKDRGQMWIGPTFRCVTLDDTLLMGGRLFCSSFWICTAKP